MTAIRRVGDQLDRVNDPTASTNERVEGKRRLLEEIDLLWRTGQLRSTQLLPLDEVRAVASIFDETLFRAVPEIYRALDRALDPAGSGRRPSLVPAFLRFGSWVGGDRDGNPSITPAITSEAMEIHAEHVLIALENAATRIGRSLTADALTTPPRNTSTVFDGESSGAILRRPTSLPQTYCRTSLDWTTRMRNAISSRLRPS